MLQTMFHLTCTWQKIFSKHGVTFQLISDVAVEDFFNQITSLPTEQTLRLSRRSKLITLKLGLQNVQRVLHAGATYNKHMVAFVHQKCCLLLQNDMHFSVINCLVTFPHAQC